MASGFEPGKIYEVVYDGQGSGAGWPGPTAVRDTVSYLKYGGVAALNDTPIDDFHKDIRAPLGIGIFAKRQVSSHFFVRRLQPG